MMNNATRNLLQTARRAAFPLALAVTLTANIGLANAGDGYEKKLKKKATPSVATLFDAMISAEECAPVDEHTCGKSCKQGWMASEKLGKLIVRDTASFDAFEPLFREQFALKSTSAESRGRLLGFLAHCPSESSAALGEDLFAMLPAAFDEAQLVAFAGMGSKSFHKELVERVQYGQTSSSLPAAFLAFNGSDTGRKALVKASQAELELSTVHEALLAGAALDALEGEGAPSAELDTVLRRLHDTVLANLDSGDLETARNLALAAKVVTKKLEAHASSPYSGGGFSLNNLQTDVAWTLRSKAEKLVTAEQVFAVIEEITPIS